MDFLKRLQEKYKAKKITKEKYDAGVKDLLEDGDLDQEQHDDALKFDPEAKGEDFIYTQEDVDKMAVSVGRRYLRKALKEAGVELDVDNKGLMAKVAELAKNGLDGKGATATEAELKALQDKAAKVDSLQKKLDQANLELAVVSQAADFNPHNPAQVVRALRDYQDKLDLDDETGAPTPDSVKAALRKLQKAEPNLFKKPKGGQGDDDDNQDDDKGGQGGGGFRGKPPGGAGASGGGGGGGKDEQTTNTALEMLGFKQQEKK